MTTPPISRSKLSCKGKTLKTDATKDNDTPLTATTTPSTRNQFDSDDYSPIYFPLTQEANEEIDVLWDWHSPSQRKRKKQKRLMPVQSPKIPVKPFPSNNQTQSLERLKQELKLLQEELAQPDDESCLCVSPQQEQEIKTGAGDNLQPSQQPNDELEDLFNDSMDEQLVLFSQTVENELAKRNKPTVCDTSNISTLIHKYTGTAGQPASTATKNPFDSTFDSFALSDTLSAQGTPKPAKFGLQRTLSDNSYAKSNSITQTASRKLEFRAKSFEAAGNGPLSKATLEEIERKRLEAKAKLEAKMRKNAVNKSPAKCSPEEIEKKRLAALAKLEAKRMQDAIEKKRLEALAKLEAKRMQEMVERKRQEALKRLQLSRMRR